MNSEIMFPNIILCEGRDEFSFLVNYLKYLSKTEEVFDTIQVMNFGGIRELNRQFRQLLKMPGFSMVKSILIIRDAENDAQSAKDSICSALHNNGFAAPKGPGMIINGRDDTSVAYMLFPSCDEYGMENGTLEDLCLKLIDEENHREIELEVNGYLSALKSKYSINYPRIHKNKLHMIISSYDKYVGAKAGEAGLLGLYDWDSSHLEKLRNIMFDLCQTNVEH